MKVAYYMCTRMWLSKTIPPDVGDVWVENAKIKNDPSVYGGEWLTSKPTALLICERDPCNIEQLRLF